MNPGRTPGRHLIGLPVFLLSLHLPLADGATNLSVWVFPGPSGRLVRQPDALGNRIADTSGVGYRGGTVPLPSSNTVPVRAVVWPVAGDNTANIQSAINQVQVMPMDTNGFRGAVLLTAGEYPCAGTVRITASGVVLRGAGSSTNGSGTVLRATATNQYTLVQITGSGSAATSTARTITNQYVPVGARSFHVNSASGLAVGDQVYVRRYTTTNWIHDIGMDLLTNPWTPSGYTINMDRTITRLEGNRVFLDAPVTCALDAFYTNGALVKFTWTGRITNSGIEHIYGKSDYFGSTTNETHAWIFVQFNSIENGWARDLVSQYFGYACVALYNGARRVTVADCRCLDPVSIITGGRRYAFVMDDNQLCLVKNCYTRHDRHEFVTQSLTTGPNVFVDGLSDNAHGEAGPHHRWATAGLWDNITVNGHDLDAQNTCESGTGHGWEGANCVIWNSKANNLKVASPPTARNWLIGSVGNVGKGGDCHGVVSAPGAWDSSGPGATNVFPDSLYFADLQDRLAEPKLQPREYWLGVIDGFTNTLPRDVVTPDPAWSNAVKTLAGSQPLDSFNVVTNNHWIPFTFRFNLSPNEHIVAATLSLALRAANSAAADVLYLGDVANSFTFSSLGWLPIGTGINTTARVLDLSGQLTLLTNGLLNVAVKGDAGVDWALLELQVAPRAIAVPVVLTPVADATVRGGASAANNFGTAATLTVRQDASASNIQQAYLRWDLSGVAGSIEQARVVLTPVNSGAGGIEQGVAVALSNNWTETGITWNNQPGRGERFATWMAAAGAQVSFDVTPDALEALSGDRQLAFSLFSITTNSVDYASREDANPANRPQLVLSLLGSPPTISSIADQAIAVNATTGPIPFTIGGASNATLSVSGDSSNPALVPGSNLVFGGSGTNLTVTVTPAANQSGVALITVTVADLAGLAASTSFTLTVSSHPASVMVWNGPGAGANTWSASGHWSPAQMPEFLDDVKFFDGGAAGVAVSNVNNYVDGGFGGNISSLQYGNTNGNHTTALAPGATLTLAGAKGLVAGTETDNGTAQTVFATVTGPGGALVLNHPAADLVIRQGTANSGGSQRATLDLSGLGAFTSSLNQILVGCVGPVNRATGTLYLSRTNALTLTGTPGICAGDNNSNSGGPNFIYLGATNAVFTDSITVARQKATATLKFNPALANGAALFRASDGAGRVSAWNIADNSLQSTSSSSANGTNDFSGGSVDALVDSLVLGRSQKTTGANSYGVLTFASGIFDVNTLQIGFQSQSGAASAGVGRVNVMGTNATLLVRTLLELGHTSGGAGTTNTFGTLFVSGGSVSAGAIAAGPGSGTNLLALNNGTLAVAGHVGTPADPISLVALTNATLKFRVATGVTNLVATSFATGGTSNAIGIAALPDIGSLPAQFPLLAYSGAIGGSGFNFTLGALPGDAVYGGYLFNHLAARTVDLVITNYILPDTFITWNGTVDGNWDTETANWKNNVTADLTYAEGDAVVFNDSATGTTTVNLADTLTPASVTVSNGTRTFAFIGAGGLSGGAALLKQGPGTLILAHSGTNDFSGGISIDAGTLQVGNGGAAGNLPAGTVNNNGSVRFNLGRDLTVDSVISGAGSLTQQGSNVLTLGGANSYSGTTTICRGTLKVASASALGAASAAVIVTNTGALDVNGLSLVPRPVTVSGGGVSGGGAIVNSGASQVSALRTVTVAGDVTFGGASRWDIRNTGGAASLLSGGQPFKIVKVGPNQVSLVGVNPIDPALGDIDVREGVFAVQTSTTQLGDPNGTLTVRSNATLNLWALAAAPLNRKISLENGAVVWNESGSSSIIGPIALSSGTVTFNVGGTALTLSNNVVGGLGGLAKTGPGTLTLRGANSFTGDTLVNAGVLALAGSGSLAGSSNITLAAGTTLDVSSRPDTTLTLLGGQALYGNGVIQGSLLVGPGATVSPGSTLGGLTVNNSVTLRGATLMELNSAANTNDVLRAMGGINYGGTLALANPGVALAAGDTFKLFYAPSYAGAFTNILPAIPALNLGWDAATLAIDGALRVVSAPTPQPRMTSASLSGADLVLAGTNGVPGWIYYVLTSTNVSFPLADWRPVATNQFDAAGSFILTIPLEPAAANGFYVLRLRP